MTTLPPDDLNKIRTIIVQNLSVSMGNLYEARYKANHPELDSVFEAIVSLQEKTQNLIHMLNEHSKSSTE